jgi:hypothetical protein
MNAMPTVLRTMAVNRVLAGMTLTGAVERIPEDMLAAGIDIREIVAAPRYGLRIPGEVARESAMMSPTIPI